jgi:hypothetical protein
MTVRAAPEAPHRRTRPNRCFQEEVTRAFGRAQKAHAGEIGTETCVRLLTRCLPAMISVPKIIFRESQNDLYDQCGEPGGTRTRDPMIKSHVLYRLSYGLVREGQCASAARKRRALCVGGAPGRVKNWMADCAYSSWRRGFMFTWCSSRPAARQ